MATPSANHKPNLKGATPSGQMDMTKMEEKRLTRLVSEGKITDTQKAAILAELTLLRTKYATGKMQEMLVELKSWAKEQNISEEYVLGSQQPFGSGGPVSGNKDNMPPPPMN